MFWSQQIKIVHTQLYKSYSNSAHLVSWRQWLEICRETASEAKKYDRAAIITDLIRFDLNNPGPHTDDELNQLIVEHLN